MTIEQNVPFLQHRKALGIKVVAMGRKNATPVKFKKAIVRQDRKLQDHLVNFRIAVSSDAQDFLLHGIQKADHFLRIIFLWQVVPGAMVEDVAEQKQPVSLLAFIGSQHFPSIIGRTVNIRCNH